MASKKQIEERNNKAMLTAEVNVLKQFVEGYVLSAEDTLKSEVRPVDIVNILLPERQYNGSDYLKAIKDQDDEELMAAVQLAKIYQDLRQAARKFYQFRKGCRSLVERMKWLLGIAPKSRK